MARRERVTDSGPKNTRRDSRPPPSPARTEIRPRTVARRRSGAWRHAAGFLAVERFRFGEQRHATRGRLAEFIVANALSVPSDGVRDEWRAYDLKTPDGVTVEVKSGGLCSELVSIKAVSDQLPDTQNTRMARRHQSARRRVEAASGCVRLCGAGASGQGAP